VLSAQRPEPPGAGRGKGRHPARPALDMVRRSPRWHHHTLTPHSYPFFRHLGGITPGGGLPLAGCHRGAGPAPCYWAAPGLGCPGATTRAFRLSAALQAIWPRRCWSPALRPTTVPELSPDTKTNAPSVCWFTHRTPWRPRGPAQRQSGIGLSWPPPADGYWERGLSSCGTSRPGVVPLSGAAGE